MALKHDVSRSKVMAGARAALEKKAENLRILDISEHSSFTDYFLICSGQSDRQVRAIADSIGTLLKQAGHRPASIEGLSDSRWVLMDFGDLVVHVFLDALREYYDLESLWADAPRVPIPAEYYGVAASQLHG